MDVHHQHYDGVTHEFFGMGAVVDKAKQAVEVAGGRLRAAFSQQRGTKDQGEVRAIR